jgi:hypothetical protein
MSSEVSLVVVASIALCAFEGVLCGLSDPYLFA